METAVRRLVVCLAAAGLMLAACTSDPTTSEEYANLEQQLAAVNQQLAEATASAACAGDGASGWRGHRRQT